METLLFPASFYFSFVILTVFKNCFLVSVSVQFTYVESYPDEGPIIELKSLEGLTDSHIDSLQEFLNEKVKYYSSTCIMGYYKKYPYFPLQMSQYTYYYQKQSPPPPSPSGQWKFPVWGEYGSFLE
jgi:hypothetical protein